MNLRDLGWNDFFEQDFKSRGDAGCFPGRILTGSRQIYEVETEIGRAEARVSGRFLYEAEGDAGFPVTGDWVILRSGGDRALIEGILARRSLFSRKSPGRAAERQAMAANIDVMCIVNSLDGGRNFNLRGIERYLVMVRESGADPVLVLNKSDLCGEPDEALRAARSSAGDVPVFLVSALAGGGIEEFSKIFSPGSTSAFTGPSGTGKSALINALLGREAQKTGQQRPDDLRGRHTTTRRELFFLPGGAMVIDTPGLREMQIWGAEAAADDAFADIAEAASRCRFRDCTHGGEPGCAVTEALREGLLERERFQNYVAVRREMAYLNSRVDEKQRQQRKAGEKALAKKIKEFYRDRK